MPRRTDANKAKEAKVQETAAETSRRPTNPQLSLRVPDEVRIAIEESAKLLGMEPNDFLRMYLVKHADDMRRLAKEMAAVFNK